MEHKAEILMIADDDFLYGIEKGYYPSIIEGWQNGKMEILSFQEYKKRRACSEISVLTEPEYAGEDLYIRNPYTNSYVSLLDDDIFRRFINEQSLAMKEVFVRLGAKRITLEEDISNKESSKTALVGNAGNVMAKSHFEVAYQKALSLNLHTLIESVDSNRTPKRFSEVQNYILSHGFEKDAGIMLLLERLKEDGRLHGQERYEITFCSEIQSALKFLSDIKLKLFDAGLDFSTEYQCVHSITKKLFLDFG